MKDLNEIDSLMSELLDNVDISENKVTPNERAREIVDEISSYAVNTKLFQEHSEKGTIFEGSTFSQIFGYLLDRIVNAPSWLHRDTSIILIMPFVNKALKKEVFE